MKQCLCGCFEDVIFPKRFFSTRKCCIKFYNLKRKLSYKKASQERISQIRKESSLRMKKENPMRNYFIRRKQSDTRKELFKSGKLTIFNKNTNYSESRKRRMSEITKRLWENDEYAERVIESTTRAITHKKSSFEKKIEFFIQKNNLPYKYVGDGSFRIGRKCPDFVNVNGEKTAIEVFASWMKIRRYGSVDNYINSRTNEFEKFGWKIFFFNEKEYKDEKLFLERLK